MMKRDVVILNPLGDADSMMRYLSKGDGSALFKKIAWQFANVIVQADMALDSRSSYISIRNHAGNIEPLLLKYGKMILAKKAPEGWEKLYLQILDSLDPKTLPFSLKNCNPECIALLKYCENTEFYDPVLDELLGVLEYERSYLDRIVSSLASFDVEARINFICGAEKVGKI